MTNYVAQFEQQRGQQETLIRSCRKTIDELLTSAVKELPFDKSTKDYTLKIFTNLLDDYRDSNILYGEIKTRLEVAENDPAWNE